MYQRFSIGNVQIKNRLVASAMFVYGAVDGKMSEKLFDRYRKLAEGGSGLIITGMNAVTKSGATAPVMVDAEYPGYEEDLAKLVDSAHDHNAKLIVQLQHCGARTWSSEGYDRFSVCATQTESGPAFHEATTEELREVERAFAKASLRCKAAGADGVQIHAAHGFLINSFLSPSTNRRTDEYGGAIENRARLLFEIYGNIRNAVGPDFVVGVKFPFSDRIERSTTPEESLFVCEELSRRGINFIEVTSGMVMELGEHGFTPMVSAGSTEAPFRDYAAQVARHVRVPVISVCGYRSPEVVEETLATTDIAAVSFGRPLVREPDLPNRWKTDPSPAKCISCNACQKSFDDGIITCQVAKH